MDILNLGLWLIILVIISFFGISFNYIFITIYVDELPIRGTRVVRTMLATLLYIPFLGAIVAGLLLAIRASGIIRKG